MTTAETNVVKRKRFYKEKEFVFIKETKQTGRVVSIDKAKLEVVVTIKDGDNIVTKTLKFMEIDKLRNTKPKESKVRDIIMFAKVVADSDATIPSKRDGDGCYDIYASFDEEEIIIMPHDVKAIPTGIASTFSPKYRFNAKRERGSTGKYAMSVVSGQIDSNYTGEWFIAINNTGSKPVVISKRYKEVHINELGWTFYPYTKAVCQAALEIVPNVEIKEVSYNEIESLATERGKGKYGSSGK